LVIFWLAVLGAGMVLTVSALVLIRMLPLLLLAGVVAGISSHRRWRTHRARAVAAPSAEPSWQASRARFARLQREYAQFECDALAVLHTPALADVSVPSTARFVDAFAEAQALDSDREPPDRHAERFAAAVDRAWRAWEAARDAADRIRLAGVPAAERATVERAIALLTLARDSGHEAERVAAYARARAELAKLERSGSLRLPRAAAAALASAEPERLPASGVTAVR